MAEQRKRVLVLNHFAAPRGQAGGTRHVELFGRLEGWDHLIIASDLNPQTGERIAAEPGFAVVHVPAYSSNGLKRILNWMAYAFRAFLLGIRQRDVDVVYGSSPHLLAGLTGWGIAALRRTPFVMEVRDLWPRVLVEMGQIDEKSNLFKALTGLELFLYARAVQIVVMAEGSRNDLVARGVPAHKIVYIPNGADPKDFVASAPRDVLRERFGFTRFTAIYTGAHGPANGLNLLLDGAEGVRDLPIDIVLVGGGLSKPELQREAQRRHLRNVRFLDPVPKQEIPDLLHAADIGLHVLADVALFREAVSPNKVFDYMASGLPVLTNSPGLVTDLVHQSGCGIATAPGNLATGLRDAFERPIAGLGAAGVRWIQVNQSRTAMADRLRSVLEASIGTRSA